MSLLKSIVLIVASAFLLVGSIGVGVFSNVCEKDGLEVSYFVPNDRTCCSQQDNDQSAACSSEKKQCCVMYDSSDNDGGCCSSSLELIKVDLDFLNKLDVKAVLSIVFETVPVWESEDKVIDEKVQLASESDPPPLVNKISLSYHQKWLI